MNNRKFRETPIFFSWIMVLVLGLSCQSKEVTLSERGLVPIPRSVQSDLGGYYLTADSRIQLIGDSETLEPIATYFVETIRPSTGFEPEIGTSSGNLVFELTKAKNELESYEISIESTGVHITSGTASGIFYAVQTLLQTFPPEILSPDPKQAEWFSPGGVISDSPEYGYRGAMLDVARHFIPMEDVKYFIDQMARLKLNMLHLHLSDDQGWRIEIKSWPRLTEIGGSTEVGGGEGGFFTQEEYQEIVRYASEQFITVIPEIDMPGHTNAALAAYGELNPGINLPDGDFSTVNKPEEDHAIDFSDKTLVREPAELYTGIAVGFSTFDTKLEKTYELIDDVVRELSALTPGPYIHIGGDESHVTGKEDYIYFVNRVQEIVQRYGKTAIGWDEVATGTLLPGNIAQFWALEENAQLAIAQGNQVLLSPAKKMYLDMQYDSTSRIGLHWAAFIELDSAYLWDPATYSEYIDKKDIIGIESPLWTETVENREDIDYLTFPRLAAHAEVGWSPASTRDWGSFESRIRQLGKAWDYQGIQFYRSPKVNW